MLYSRILTIVNILGISAFYHDSAACLVQDGKIIAAAQEERFTRKKHDYAFPKNAIEYCLKAGNINVSDINYVTFYEKTFLKFERLLETYIAYTPFGIRSFIKAMPLWIKQKLWIKQIIQDQLEYKGKILFTEHHESHCASAFYPSPYNDAAILTMDGVGEWATVSYGLGSGNDLNILGEIKFPHSVGLLYSSFTHFTGFKVNSGEYKLMGLAPYGEPKYKDLILNELLDLKEDGSFKLNMKYFDYCTGLKMTNKNFNKLFGGEPRKPESKLTQREVDIAKSIQVATEEVVLRIARHVHKETKHKYLCLAGGVALNCVATGRLLREGPFEDIWIQPASGDAGGALGAALFTWYKYLDNDRKVDGSKCQFSSYLGPGYNNEEIQEFLDRENIPYKELNSNELTEEVADLIAKENIIGWFQGRMEFGPRALGARSIIADARSPKMQEVMNLKIKFRESFRPFAPSVLKEKAKDYFYINPNYNSPYMLLTFEVREEYRKPVNLGEKIQVLDKLKIQRSDIPAVTHIDFSARLQTVDSDTNPLYYAVIKKFDEKYGCPLIINTSFNVRGEPIVCTPEEAFRCFMRTNIDYFVLGNFLLDKKKQKKINIDTKWMKEFELD